MDRTVVDDILAHAAAEPAATALVLPAATVSYGELAARIDGLARVLVARGVRPERVCAVALDRGVDTVVAMCAVLRAGGAFLTLDVDLPGPRLAAMVHSAGAQVLLSTSTLADRLALPVDGPTILLDRLPEPPAVALPSTRDGRCLAYVSHTSGSTGRPNAVLVQHSSLDSYLRFVVRDYGLGPWTVALQTAPLGYDASIRDTLAPLAAGGRLVLVPRGTLLRPGGFVETVSTFGVDTVLSVTPSFLAFLDRRAAAEHLPTVRVLACSGESLRPLLAAGGRALVAGRLVNQYGPTECTMTSTRFDVPLEPDTATDLVGTPIDGVTVHLLDPDLRAVPAGAVGRVHIGGVGVARGYGGRPGRTADVFLPDPFGPPGARMYDTGDLARRLPDGNLEYLGRTDRQLKIRGHRVDPAEIEGALLAHPGVTGAVATTATDERGRGHLLVHVAGDLAGTTDAALRAHLATTLPPHMMPRRFVRVDRIPTTRTGKADRTLLSTVDGVR
jgi:D-alanine--poly(phosphoribitol) ligase subunit 1